MQLAAALNTHLIGLSEPIQCRRPMVPKILASERSHLREHHRALIASMKSIFRQFHFMIRKPLRVPVAGKSQRGIGEVSDELRGLWQTCASAPNKPFRSHRTPDGI